MKTLKEKEIRCIYCKKPITVFNFVEVSAKGFLCNNPVCLVKDKKNKSGFEE